jgi:membrane protease YdiL (CAAX protease family)
MQPEFIEELALPESPQREPFWGWADFFLVLGLLVSMLGLLFLVAGASTLVFPSLKTDQSPLLLPLQLAFYAAIYFTFLIAFRFRYNKPVFTSLGWRRTVSDKTLVLIGLGGLILSPVVSGIATLAHTPEVHIEALDQLQKQPVILAIFGVMAVTIAPLFEEMLFRGFMQPLFCRSLGVVPGIVLTGVLFGALHGPEYQMVWQYVAAISLVGIALGIVRYRTSSIIPSTVMHACYNAVAAVSIFFQHPK